MPNSECKLCLSTLAHHDYIASSNNLLRLKILLAHTKMATRQNGYVCTCMYKIFSCGKFLCHALIFICTGCNLQLVQKRNMSSAIRTYFGFEPDQEGRPKDNSKPVCKLCLKKGTTRIVATKGANTSNLHSYLKTTRPSVYVRVKPAKSNGPASSSQAKQTGGQQSLATSFAKDTMYARGSKK